MAAQSATVQQPEPCVPFASTLIGYDKISAYDAMEPAVPAAQLRVQDSPLSVPPGS